MTLTIRHAARILTAVVPAAMITILGFTATAQAAAPTVSCGATLTANAKMTKSLTCASGNGVTLGKGVVLDLGGFKLVGSGSTGTAVTFSPDGGSTVSNGIIQGWGIGVSANSEDATAPVPTGKISNVTLKTAPVSAYYSVLTIANSTLSSSPLDVSASTFTSTGSKFTKSSVNGFSSKISLSGATIVGGSVDNASSFGVTIDKSSLDGTGYTGAPAHCSETDVTITNSTVKNYTAPVSGYYCTINFASNTFSANKGGVLGSVTDGSNPGEVNTTITNNTFKSSGIVLDSGAMNVVGNTFTGNTTGLIAEDPANTTITGNTFSSNTSSGVRTTDAGLSVGNNKALNNGRYGINVPGAVDLGGNVASGNTLGDCIGVACAAA